MISGMHTHIYGDIMTKVIIYSYCQIDVVRICVINMKKSLPWLRECDIYLTLDARGSFLESPVYFTRKKIKVCVNR